MTGGADLAGEPLRFPCGAKPARSARHDNLLVGVTCAAGPRRRAERRTHNETTLTVGMEAQGCAGCGAALEIAAPWARSGRRTLFRCGVWGVVGWDPQRLCSSRYWEERSRAWTARRSRYARKRGRAWAAGKTVAVRIWPPCCPRASRRVRGELPGLVLQALFRAKPARRCKTIAPAPHAWGAKAQGGDSVIVSVANSMEGKARASARAGRRPT